MQALAVTRAGDDPMFDRMLNGLNLGAGIGVVGRDVSGSEALRRHASFRSNIANGDFRAVANTLNTTNIGVNVPAGETIAGGTLRSSGLFPENFITANPQFTTMEMRNNSDTSTYHSMQTQVTMRPARGLTYQATWTWSRATGVAGNTPGGGGITAAYRDFMINRTGTPDIVGKFSNDGQVAWDSLASSFGNYFAEQYRRVPDPSCAAVASNLKLFCTNTAIADANGNIILQNAAPGQLGTLGLRPIYGPGSWDMDANLQKSIRISESRNLTFRLDATNIFNHPTPGNPNLDINAGTFGEINTKTGNRALAAQVPARVLVARYGRGE